jgi:alpha-beta hydrolase superfamily lysophospholipase
MTVLGHVVRRNFDVVVRYPVGAPGRWPLIVFGHGYAVTPRPYAPLLDAWTRAGYVVAAPIFPLENANAPGGPNENDLVNQPADMSLVITSLQDASSGQAAQVARKINFRSIALAGQSDGGDTALAAAYGPQRDPRISAAVILSGAEDPFAPRFALAADGPPLLATQGTADTINPPWQTYQFFQSASPPKYLLKLFGAGHLPPYTQPGPELSEVQRTTLAFLDRYLRGRTEPLQRLIARGSPGPGSQLIADR